MKQIVIDASVAAKWLLPDEDHPQAELIKKDFAGRELSVAVPMFIFYEINNLLKSAVSSNRIKPQEAIDLYKSFLDIEFTVHSLKHLFLPTLNLALKLNISSYDASYIVLAEYLQISFFTADEKLVKKANNQYVLSLTEYLPPASS